MAARDTAAGSNITAHFPSALLQNSLCPCHRSTSIVGSLHSILLLVLS